MSYIEWMPSIYGAVEMGGTKTSCAVGSTPQDLTDVLTFPTTTPEETLATVIGHLRDHPVEGVGIASFGPVELRADHPSYGRITITPKAGWSGADVVAPVRDSLAVPVGFDTDVNGAAIGEARWGAGRDLGSFVYVTVGTGIGGGAMVGGHPIHGLGHPEMGHMSVRRQPNDPFPGICSIHGGCLEGLASGPAIEARFGLPGDQLTEADLEQALRLETFYLGQMMRNLVYTLAPEKVIMGGGVASMPGLLDAVSESLGEELGGYPGLEEHGPGFVVPPGLGPLSGLAGGLALAEAVRG
jgi:fructokinase